ncbi:hypothetical protein DEA06_10470 [Microbacterium sp. Gd 4-13]|nr:hypothetical protein DEA06_10470 [Microbacterium sp. Gd 4-13]
MDRFDDPAVTVAALTRRCQRVASLRGDAVALAWLSLESTDIANEFKNKSEATRETLAARLLKTIPSREASVKWKAEYDGYIRRRTLPDKQEANLRSVQQIEELAQMLREQEAATLVPPPHGMHSYDLGKHVAEQAQGRARLVESRIPLEAVLARIKDRLWEFLTETEYELTFGEATAETFDRLRSYVDKQLTTIAPPALEQFQAAYRRLKDGGDEDRAHALTSCRRVLKTLADQLYPASSEPVTGFDGKARVLDDAKFVNRLVQYVAETVGKHENGAVVQAALEDIGARLGALNELASKGVHAEVTTYEVDTCVVQTYLVVADVLRIRERAAPPERGGTT